MGEVERVRHPQVEGMHLFFDTVEYRAPHVHRELELLWVLRGTLHLEAGGAWHAAEPGQLAVFGAGQPHELAGPGCTFLCLQVDPRLLAFFDPEVQSVQLETPLPAQKLPAPQTEQVKQCLRRLARAYLEQPPFYQLECAGQACLAWNLLLANLPVRTVRPQDEKRDARVQRLIQFVDENHTRRIRLADFARAEGCSVNHMSFFVRSALNQTFQQYVTSVRFQHACRLMEQGCTRMTDVCWEAGFSDYRYFSRAFRRRLGMTPEEYGRRAKDLPRLRPQNPLSREQFYSREKSLELLALLDRDPAFCTRGSVQRAES